MRRCDDRSHHHFVLPVGITRPGYSITNPARRKYSSKLSMWSSTSCRSRPVDRWVGHRGTENGGVLASVERSRFVVVIKERGRVQSWLADQSKYTQYVDGAREDLDDVGMPVLTLGVDRSTTLCLICVFCGPVCE